MHDDLQLSTDTTGLVLDVPTIDVSGSITLNGVLLKHGIPTTSSFGGLLELREGRAIRFVEMIHYDGTSIDPLVTMTNIVNITNSPGIACSKPLGTVWRCPAASTFSVSDGDILAIA